MTLDPAVATLLSGCIALLFAGAALHKLRDLRRFQEIFAAYGLMPGRARLRLSLAVPAVEALVALGVLFGVSRQVSSCTAVVLLLAYAAAIALNLSRGRRDLACGCGGPNDRRPIAEWMVWRNLCLASVAMVLLAPWGSRPLGVTDVVTIAFGTAACSLVYLCIDRLLSHSSAPSARLGAA
jgi:hypothetical protein